MNINDLLPLIGIAIGWLLAEGTAFGRRVIERKRTVGKALSVLYFVFMEMVQLKAAQERFKSLTNDVKEWERLRQRSFEKYVTQDAEFAARLNATADVLGEYYPIEAYTLREIFAKYQFVKGKKLDAFTGNPNVYIAALSSYESGYLAYQYQLELIIRFLAFRQSKFLWAKIRYRFWQLRRRVPKGDMVFFQQLGKLKRKVATLAASNVAAESDDVSKEPSGGG